MVLIIIWFHFKEVIGYITNMGLALTEESFGMLATASTNPSMLVPAAEQDRIYPMSDYLSYLAQESGYFHIQATKPYTVGKLICIMLELSGYEI